MMSVAAQVDSQREEYGSGASPGFKAGDRVRRVTVSSWPEDYGELGREYVVLSVGRNGNPVVIEGKSAADRSAFVLVASPLRIEAGKFYRTRDGRKVGPMVAWVHLGQWVDSSDIYLVGLWNDLGGSLNGRDDIIAEWVDEPQASNDNSPSTAGFTIPLFDEGEPQSADLTITISLNADNLHQELDEIIAKLKKIKKLQRQTGLAA